MSAYITRIKEGGAKSGASAYSKYVLGNGAELPEVESVEIGADSAASYAAYATAELQATRWFGRQAAAWGLEGKEVTADALTAVLGHTDPITGADLDAGRVARLASRDERVEKWQKDRVRWAANPQLKDKAAACSALRKEVADGAIRDLDAVSALADKHLAGLFTADEMDKIAVCAMKSVLANKDLNRALKTQQGRMRLVPPKSQPPRVSASPTNEVIGYDVTFSPPAGTRFLLFDKAIRDEAVEAKHRAAMRTLSVLEDELTAVRSGVGGRQRGEALGLAIAIVTHFTGRPAGDPPVSDPDLHLHCVVPSLVQNAATGEWSTIDSRAWFAAKGLIQAIYDGELRSELTATLGTAWRERETRDPITGRLRSHWEMVITGDDEVDDSLITGFSRRSVEILEEIERRREAGEKVRKDVVWAATRNAKDEVSLGDSLEEWKERLAGFGFEAEAISAGACWRASVEDRNLALTSIQSNRQFAGPMEEHLATIAPEEQAQVVAEWTRWVGERAEKLAHVRATFGRQHLLLAALNDAPPTVSPSLIVAQVDLYLSHVAREIVPEASASDPTAWMRIRWTTDAQIDREWAALVTLDALQQPAGVAASAGTARTILEEFADDGGGLTVEQELLYLAALRDPEAGRITACVAPAGAGKGHVAKAIAEAWRREGAGAVAEATDAEAVTRKVVSLSLASRAGVGMSKDLIGGADFHGSIDRMMTALEHGAFTLDEKTLVIIDEAGMASLVKLHDILETIEKSGARALLFGDPEQIDAPGASGGLLHYLDAHGHAVRLDTTVRNRDERIRNAQLAWRSALERDEPARAGSTLSTWVNEDLVSVVDGEDAARDLAFEKWRERYETTNKLSAQWESDRHRLERDVKNQPKGPARREAQAALDTHLASPVDRSILVLAERHEDVAQLSDRIQAYLIESGAIDARHTVDGVRYAPRQEGREHLGLKSTAGVDLSKTVFAKGLEVRVTTNTRSGHLSELLEQAIAHERQAYKGNAIWQEKFAFGRSPEVRSLAQRLKASQVLNGELGVVEAVHRDGGLTVRITGVRGDNDRLVRLSRSQLKGGAVVPAAGGAITLHSAQGRTVEATITVAGPQSAGDLLYVAQSRSRGDSELIYAADLDLKDPRLVQWQNDRRKALLAGEDFDRPAPVEAIPGLWQLADRWSNSDRSMLAIHEGEKAAHGQQQRDGVSAEEAQAFVQPGDLAEAMELVRLQGGGTAEDIDRLAAQLANQRVAQERLLAELTRLRREGLQKTEGLSRERSR